MDRNIDLFVQAFWVKCREIIRPEIDATIDHLRHAGHEANVSTQEFSETAERLPAPAGPSVTLALRPATDATASATHAALEFRGDVGRQAVDVLVDGEHSRSYELAVLGSAEVKAEIDAWLGRRAAASAV